jgi:hypothetical protein
MPFDKKYIRDFNHKVIGNVTTGFDEGAVLSFAITAVTSLAAHRLASMRHAGRVVVSSPKTRQMPVCSSERNKMTISGTAHRALPPEDSR